MAKMVGYACSMKLSWLNKAYQMTLEGLDENSYKEQLNEYLSFEIDGPTRLRKTREILMNVWYKDTKEIAGYRETAKGLFEKYPEYAPAFHLCLIYLNYPVVADVCRFMGRIFEFQDDVTNTILKQKLFDEWGERGTLDTTARRVTLTLKELGLLKASNRTRYELLQMEINNDEIVNFLLTVAMRLEGNSYYTFSELRSLYVLFPFKFQVSKEQLMNDNKLMTSSLGGEFSVSLKK